MASTRANTVRCVFEIKGDDSAATPSRLVADVSTLTVRRLREHAISTVADKHPASRITVLVDHKELTGHDEDLVHVPQECIIKPVKQRRAPHEGAKAAKEEGGAKDDGEESGDDDGDVVVVPKPTAAAETEQEPAKATDEATESEAKKPDAEGAEAEAASKPAVEGEESPAAATEGGAIKPAAAAPRPKKTVPKREPPPPPKDLLVQVRISATVALPKDRSSLLKPGQRVGVCAACGECDVASVGADDADAPVLLDCGHIVCFHCVDKYNTAKARQATEAAAKEDEADGAAEEGAATAAAAPGGADGEEDGKKATAGARKPRTEFRPRRPQHKRVTFVGCPVCGFHTITPAAFKPIAEVTEGDELQVPAHRFRRDAHSAVNTSKTVVNCAVCTAAPAVGRCEVEHLNMCGKCHEEHLPSGPLRNQHTLVRFEGTASVEVLCSEPDHRRLVVTYLCVDHGKLGCHMCLRDTTDHAKCHVLTKREELTGVAKELRTFREAEVASVQNAAAKSTKVAWENHASLRDSYERLRRDIEARADEYIKNVERQKREALDLLEARFTEGVQLWETRITALDAIRARTAHVAAVLDGHRDLHESMLLHAEAKRALMLEGTGTGVPNPLRDATIQPLSLRCAQKLPTLFDVNGHQPSVDDGSKKSEVKPIKAFGVRTHQEPMSRVAKHWMEIHPAAGATGAEAAAAGEGGARPARGGAGKGPATNTAAAEALGRISVKTTVTLPRLEVRAAAGMSARHEGDEADGAAAATEAGSPTKGDETVELVDFTSVSKGPKDTVLLVDAVRGVVLVAALKKDGTEAKVVKVLGGPRESHSFKTREEGTLAVKANQQYALKAPVHAFHNVKGKTIVVCDPGDDRIVLYQDHLEVTAESQSSPPKLLRGPVCAASDPASNGLIIFEKVRISIVSPDAQKVLTTIKYPGLLTKNLRTGSALKAAVTTHATKSVIAIVRATGDVALLAHPSGQHLGDYADGAIITPDVAKRERATAAHVTNPVLAVARHPTANLFAFLSRKSANASSLTLTFVGLDDTADHVDPHHHQQQQQQRPTAQQQQQQQQQHGGRLRAPAPLIPTPAAPRLVPKVFKTVQVPLTGAKVAADWAGYGVSALCFDTADRLIVGLRDMAVQRSQADDEVHLTTSVGPIKFAVLTA
jgi:hypothetical protein